jgi:protein-S-isoprenylcysteine O-methyltransferase Ste14
MNSYNQNMEIKIMPTTYFIILILLSIGFHFVFPLFKFIFSPYNYLGFGLIIFGIIMNLWTDSLFKKKQTTVKPQKMPNFFITSGPFKLSRHPMYLGMMSILLGVAIFLGSLISFAFPIIFIIIMEKLFIPLEEKNLEKKFGNQYIDYKKRVRRWI